MKTKREYKKKLTFTLEQRQAILNAMIIGKVKLEAAIEELEESNGYTETQSQWLAEVVEGIDAFQQADFDAEMVDEGQYADLPLCTWR